MFQMEREQVRKRAQIEELRAKIPQREENQPPAQPRNEKRPMNNGVPEFSETILRKYERQKYG